MTPDTVIVTIIATAVGLGLLVVLAGSGKTTMQVHVHGAAPVPRHRQGSGWLKSVVIVAGILGLIGFGANLVHEEELKERQAKAQLQKLDDSLIAYRRLYGKYPPTLESLNLELRPGQRPWIDYKELQDPWGRSFGYDPAQLHPISLKPLVWSGGGLFRGPSQRIRNWDMAW